MEKRPLFSTVSATGWSVSASKPREALQ